MTLENITIQDIFPFLIYLSFALWMVASLPRFGVASADLMRRHRLTYFLDDGFYSLLSVIAIIMLVILFFDTAWSHPQFADNKTDHAINIAVIVSSLLSAQLVRLLIESFITREGDEVRGHLLQHYSGLWQKACRQLFPNVVLYTWMYVCAHSEEFHILAFVWVGLFFQLFRVGKFRLYDDFVVKHVLLGVRQTWHPTADNDKWIGAPVVKFIFDNIFRSYVFSNLAFAIAIYSLSSHFDFKVYKGIHSNLFVDCLYFSVITTLTVGYGDIVPKTVLAKLLVSFLAVFAYFLLVTLIATAVGRVAVSFSPRVPTGASRLSKWRRSAAAGPESHK